MRALISFVIVVSSVSAGLVVAQAQETKLERKSKEGAVEALVKSVLGAQDVQKNEADLDVALNPRLLEGQVLAHYLVAHITSDQLTEERLMSAVENQRRDKQIGAGSAGTGSTSVVSNGSVPGLLGLAFENGAVLRSTSGNSLTFRINPACLAEVLAAKGNYQGVCSDRKWQSGAGFLERVSVALSYDTNSETMGMSSDAPRLTEAMARIDLINKRDPRDSSHISLFRQRTAIALDQLKSGLEKLADTIERDPSTEERVKQIVEVIDLNTPRSIIEAQIRGLLTSLEERDDLRSLGISARAVVRAEMAFEEAESEVYKEISNTPVLTLEYSYRRPSNSEMDMTGTPMPMPSDGSASGANLLAQGMETPMPMPTPVPVPVPNLHTLRLVYSKGIGGSEFTANASGSWFGSMPEGADGSLRDVQFGAQIGIPAGKFGDSRGTLTFAGLFVSLREDPLGTPFMVNGQMIGEKGEIGVFQAKYSIGIGDSGVQIPFSFTTSNRSELIDEREVRGSFGFTFDLDKLFVKP